MTALVLALVLALLHPTAADERSGVANVVTYYGPGLFGNPTACGGILHRRTIGVASLTEPCGSLVRFAWHGRSITLRVIDRTGGVRWDLTKRAMRRFLDGRPRTLHDVAWRVDG